jgi:hypothetical protein
MLPFMGAILRTIQYPQLVRHVHIMHMSSVLDVHGRSHDILLYHVVPSRHRKHSHARRVNENYICGKK